MPISQRLFAAVYDRLGRSAEAGAYGDYRPFVAGEATGKVLEIGAGTGANLAFYSPKVSLTAADPNPHMLRRLKHKAETLGLSVEVLELGAEALPMADDSLDTVVSTLVLCSIGDPAKALGEVRRVLVPGGELRFIEHVRAGGTSWARFQDFVTPVWRWFGGGCHPNRDSLTSIRQAGLEIVEVKPFVLGPYPVRPHIAGIARKTP